MLKLVLGNLLSENIVSFGCWGNRKEKGFFFFFLGLKKDEIFMNNGILGGKSLARVTKKPK